jgi:hypothetical protein
VHHIDEKIVPIATNYPLVKESEIQPRSSLMLDAWRFRVFSNLIRIRKKFYQARALRAQKDQRKKKGMKNFFKETPLAK